VAKSDLSGIGGLLAGTRADYASRSVVSQVRDELDSKWSADPWAFLTGIDESDPNRRALILTKDESDTASPYKPFPRDKEYLHILTNELLGGHDVVLLNKSRQMMVSTLCCLLLYWTLVYRPGRRMLVSKQKEELSVELMRDKIRGPHSRTPKWFQVRHKVESAPANRIDCKGTDSYILAVAQNAAVGALRGGTASIALIDEAAFQDAFGDMMQAAAPMAAKIWAVTTANMGNPGAVYFRDLMGGL